MNSRERNEASDIFGAEDLNTASPRTMLFVPAMRPERIAKAFASGADAVIVDLEDAVTLQDKSAARDTLTQVLTDPASFGLSPEPQDRDGRVSVRINPPTSPEGQLDLELLRVLAANAEAVARLDGVVLAKALSITELDLVAKILNGTTSHLIPLIETPLGVAEARVLAAHPRVSRLALGAIDLSLKLGCEPRSTTMDYVRSELVIASALAGKQGPLDTPTAEFRDEELVRNDTISVKRAGCTGKLCIHPVQVPIVAEVFAPTEEEIDWARRVLDVEDGLGQVDGQMVDRPVILRARRILGL